jgi:hypothetical protein
LKRDRIFFWAAVTLCLVAVTVLFAWQMGAIAESAIRAAGA